jgi:hypothetical protein
MALMEERVVVEAGELLIGFKSLSLRIIAKAVSTFS